MPKTWKDTETLAGVLAWLEKSEEGADAALEEHAQEAYPAQLEFVHTSVHEFVPSQHRWGKRMYIYTLAESQKRRPKHSKGGLKVNFEEARKFCNNTILPVYYKEHGKDGVPPSGTNREKLISNMRMSLGLDTCPTDLQGGDEPGHNDEQTAQQRDKEGEESPTVDKQRKQSPAVRFWTTWLHQFRNHSRGRTTAVEPDVSCANGTESESS